MSARNDVLLVVLQRNDRIEPSGSQRRRDARDKRGGRNQQRRAGEDGGIQRLDFGKNSRQETIQPNRGATPRPESGDAHGSYRMKR